MLDYHCLKRLDFPAWALHGALDTTLIAGACGAEGYLDGTGTAARFGNFGDITHVRTSEFHGVFYGDVLNAVVRFIDLGTTEVTTAAGDNANPGLSDGLGSVARFLQPWGMYHAVDVRDESYTPENVVYVCDKMNHAVFIACVFPNLLLYVLLPYAVRSACVFNPKEEIVWCVLSTLLFFQGVGCHLFVRSCLYIPAG